MNSIVQNPNYLGVTPRGARSDMKIIKRFWPFLTFISNLFQNLRDEFPINSALHIFTFRLAYFYC